MAREAEVCETRTVFLQQRIVLLQKQTDFFVVSVLACMHHTDQVPLTPESQKQSPSTLRAHQGSWQKGGSKSDKKRTMTNSHI